MECALYYVELVEGFAGLAPPLSIAKGVELTKRELFPPSVVGLRWTLRLNFRQSLVAYTDTSQSVLGVGPQASMEKCTL